MTQSLLHERCEACEGGIPPMERRESEALMPQLAARWQLSEDAREISCQLKFKNFERAMRFLNRLAEIAESEGHHPDFCLRGWNQVFLTLSTHAIGGLSRNDFILAAKLDEALTNKSS